MKIKDLLKIVKMLWNCEGCVIIRKWKEEHTRKDTTCASYFGDTSDKVFEDLHSKYCNG